MKRADLIRHLVAAGSYLLREGGRHSIYVNLANSQTSAVGIRAGAHINTVCGLLGTITAIY